MATTNQAYIPKYTHAHLCEQDEALGDEVPAQTGFLLLELSRKSSFVGRHTGLLSRLHLHGEVGPPAQHLLRRDGRLCDRLVAAVLCSALPLHIPAGGGQNGWRMRVPLRALCARLLARVLLHVTKAWCVCTYCTIHGGHHKLLSVWWATTLTARGFQNRFAQNFTRS